LFLINAFGIQGQNFVPVPGAVFDYPYLQQIIYDSVNNQLLVSSRYLKEVNGLYVRGVCSWDGTTWDSLSSGLDTHDSLNPAPSNAVVTSCIPYNGKLLVAGQFKSIGGIDASLLALWDGANWDSLPQRAFKFNTNYAGGIVYGLYRHNGLLYIYGNFDSVAGQPTNSIATYDGNNFQPIILPVDYGSPMVIYDAIEYNNELYICGAFNNNFMPGYRSILKFDGTNWITVGGGLQYGSGAYLYSMVVYNNELYVGGHFLKAAGNAGDNVMKWDGNQWKDAQMNNGFYTVIYKMLIYHDQIWCFGGMTSAGGLAASGIAVLDSTQWCTFANDVFNNDVIGAAAVFNDTIYVGGVFYSINGDSISCFAKLQNPDNFSSCSALTVNEVFNHNNITIYPNPATSTITVESKIKEVQSIKILDVLGREIYYLQTSNNKTEIDVSQLPSGIYILQVQSKNGVVSKKFVKE